MPNRKKRKRNIRTKRLKKKMPRSLLRFLSQTIKPKFHSTPKQKKKVRNKKRIKSLISE
jgi:hypothetical protein